MTLDKDTKQKILLAIILYVAVFVMSDNLFYKPKKDKINMLKNRLNKTKQNYSIDLKKSVEVEKTKKELIAKRDEFEEKRDEFANLEDRRFLVDDITEKARKWGIELKTINFKEVNKDKYINFSMQMSVESNYQELINFLYSLDKMDKNIKVNRLNVSKRGDKISSQLSIEIIILNEVF